MRHLKWVLFVICAAGMQAQPATAQTAKQILKKASEKLQSDAYFSAFTKYSLYPDHKSSKAKEEYSGMILKKNGIYYYKIKNTEFVGFKDYAVKVSKDEKAMQIEKSAENTFPINIESLLKGYDLKLTGNDKAYWICEITPPKVSQSAFSKMTVFIRRKDYSIAAQKIYFFGSVQDDRIVPGQRLEAVFSERKPSQLDAFLVNEKNYFTRSGKEIKPAERFKGYKLYKT